MKVSLNLAQEYSNVDITSVGADEILRRIGAQLGAVEDVEYFGQRYDGIVVARVISCIKHPDADKLSVCKIDDGGLTKNVDRDQNDNIQVVCGAPNAREGLTVAWLPPGSVIPMSVEVLPAAGPLPAVNEPSYDKNCTTVLFGNTNAIPSGLPF